MLDGIDIDIQGLKEMEKALLDIAQEVGSKKAAGMMTSAFRAGAKRYENSMHRNVTQSKHPRVVKTRKGNKVTIRPGFLKSRIKVRGSTSKGGVTRRLEKNVVSRVRVGIFRVPYVVYYEYGTSHNEANPIIRNAFNQRTRQVTHVIQYALRKKINAAQKRIARKHQQK